MAGPTRTAEEIRAYLERRVKLADLATAQANNAWFRDRSAAIAQAHRATIEYIDGGAEILTGELNEERWAQQIKRQF